MSNPLINPVEALGVMSGDRLAEIVGRSGPAHASFGQLLASGVEDVSRKVADADALVAAFVLDDSIPLHQVTYALEEARLSVELMLQVRTRLVEGYQEIMRMQL